MLTLLFLMALIGVVIVLVVRLVAPRLRQERTRRRPVTNPGPDEFPEPGEPSARRPDGRPVPGSRADRQQHNKP